MIKSFGDQPTKALYEGRSPRAFRAFRAQAERKLQILDNATELADLRLPPGNRLEKLSGNRQGQWSIRINKQWRVCFYFENGHAFKAQITDYH
jgi:proteic killer suppression protein